MFKLTNAVRPSLLFSVLYLAVFKKDSYFRIFLYVFKAYKGSIPFSFTCPLPFKDFAWFNLVCVFKELLVIRKYLAALYLAFMFCRGRRTSLPTEPYYYLGFFPLRVNAIIINYWVNTTQKRVSRLQGTDLCTN